MKRVLIALFAIIFAHNLVAQNTVPFPPNPGNTNQLEPWGHDATGTNWNTSAFLPFIYNKMWFRLMPPNGFSYNRDTKTWTMPAGGQKYPLILFFHGNGESGTSNNKQLLHGAQKAMQNVQNGTFPGFLFYPQDVTTGQAKQILDRILTELPVDVNRIYVHGLSAGGNKTWEFLRLYPTLAAAVWPMSAADAGAENVNYLYQPIRQAQGDKDTNPSPAQSQRTVDYFNNNGGHLEYFLLPNVGHGTWDNQYNRSDFFTWFLQQKKNKLFVRFDRNLLCPEAPISVDMGFSPGFDAYEWRKDGVLISGATAHKYIATSYGSYTARFRRGSVWSDWADPITVGPKPVTNTPPITTNGLHSIFLPAPDGSTTAELALPEGYTSYTWRNASNQVVNSSRIFTAGVGNYTATVTELNGCSTTPSPAFAIKNAVGPNSPDAITGLIGYAETESKINISWTDNPSPAFNETGFEIYRSKNGGPYDLVKINAADQIIYSDINLTPNTTYSYKIRPINQHSAGAASDALNVLTMVDAIAPTPPSALKIAGSTPTSVSLSWTASTDNSGTVFRYDIYRDGTRVLSVPGTQTSATVYNLTTNQAYQWIVKARDITGNSSNESNLVMGSAILGGFSWKYYEAATGVSLAALPNFNSMTPVKTGFSNNISTAILNTIKNRNEQFAIWWTGSIVIPVAGNYTFMTNSDDGSKLYIGTFSESNLVVNNDGGHGAQDREGTKNFSQPGVYPIHVTYFQGAGDFNFAGIYWKNTAHGIGNTKTAIADEYLVPTQTLAGNPPAAPTQVLATTLSYDKIRITWTDNSNNENGFRIYRSTTTNGTYVPVGSVGAGVRTYDDVALAPATKYFYRVVSFGEYGESVLSNEIPRGLAYSYYEGNLSSLTQLNNYPVWKTGMSNWPDAATPPGRTRNTNFVVKWVGKIKLPSTGSYVFSTSSDDGSTLTVSNSSTSVTLNNDTDGNNHKKSSTAKTLTAGWYDIDIRWRKRTSSNSRFTLYYKIGNASEVTVSSSNATALFFTEEINATTQALPPKPLLPTSFAITSIQPFSIGLGWQDNAFDETSYQVLRSYQNGSNYFLYKTLPAGTTSFVDTDLFANATYFYKVQAVGPGGISVTTGLSATTLNNIPQISTIDDVVLKFGRILNIPVLADDGDNDPITLTVTGLPAFATFADHGDGSGNFRLTPNASQLGVYPISVTARDNHNGQKVEDFVVTVTDKDVPVISPVADASATEGQAGSMVINATSDFGAENLVWTWEGLPSFATPNISGGIATIALAPGYADSGPYTVTVTVKDQLEASATRTFNINVSDVDPSRTFSINIVNGTSANSPWNNMTGPTISSLRDNTGTVSGVGMQIVGNSWATFYEGAVTGNNSGVYPDAVIRDYLYFGFNGMPEELSARVTGLDPARSYNFTFFGSSKWTGTPDNGWTRYRIGDRGVQLRVQNNSTNTSTLTSVVPAADGSVTFTMSKAPGTPVGYLNALVVEALYQDGAVPAAPRLVTASFGGSQINLSWVDAPFNETGFDVYKATSEAGPFEKMNELPLPKNSTSYVDPNIVDGMTYYYKVTASNRYGESVDSNIANISLADLFPAITVDGATTVAPESFSMLTVTTAPDAVLEFTGLPDWMFLSPSSDQYVDVIMLPTGANAGTTSFTIKSTDAASHVTTRVVTVTVTEPLAYRISVNFTAGGYMAPAPWNNTARQPTAGAVFANLKNDDGGNTGVTLTLIDAFGGAYNEGPVTGNNSGVVPDNVLKEYYWFAYNGQANYPVRMKLSGLSPTLKYRFKFVASSIFAPYPNNGNTDFSIGNKTVSVAVQNNTTTLGVISDVVTNGSGEITITATKGAGAGAGFVNGFIIEALPVDVSAFIPSNLTAAGSTTSQIILKWNDNSPIETGYEVYRSDNGVNGTYNLITTVATDVITYNDTPPQSGKLYYYKVRANTSNGPTAYSNTAGASTIAFKVFINFAGEATYDAPMPWNNTSRFGFTGDVFSGIKDQNGNPTGMRLRVVTQLEGANNWGMVTGNNSGVFPDKVLNSYWFNDAFFPQGEFIIDGLDQSFSYNFGFLGSVNAGNNSVYTDFAINGAVVANPNFQNINTISYIRNVNPDSNSEIFFTVKETAGSPWSLLNGMVIEAFANGNPAASRKNADTRTDGNIREMRFGEASNAMTVYPNPVETDLNVRIEDSSMGSGLFEVYDLQGRKVQGGQFFTDSITSDFMVNLDLPPAYYVIKVQYPDGTFGVQKFMKR